MIVLIQFLVSGNNTECNILWKKETSLVFTRNDTKHEYTTTWEVVYFLSCGILLWKSRDFAKPWRKKICHSKRAVPCNEPIEMKIWLINVKGQLQIEFRAIYNFTATSCFQVSENKKFLIFCDVKNSFKDDSDLIMNQGWKIWLINAKFDYLTPLLSFKYQKTKLVYTIFIKKVWENHCIRSKYLKIFHKTYVVCQGFYFHNLPTPVLLAIL